MALGWQDGSFINMVKKEYLRTPPITKGYLWGSVGITVLSYVLNGNAWPKWLLLEWQPVFTRLQVRRRDHAIYKPYAPFWDWMSPLVCTP